MIKDKKIKKYLSIKIFQNTYKRVIKNIYGQILEILGKKTVQNIFCTVFYQGLIRLYKGLIHHQRSWHHIQPVREALLERFQAGQTDW